jgi:hypothetical protein
MCSKALKAQQNRLLFCSSRNCQALASDPFSGFSPVAALQQIAAL